MREELSGEAPAIPVLLGLCGCGRTTALRRIQRDLGAERCQYVDVERSATTPERFLHSLRAASPFIASETAPGSSPRGAFNGVLGFLADARCQDGAPATFLLDEVLEFRTFESFPGLRNALPELLASIASTRNHFALASRFVSRAGRAIDAKGPFVVSEVDALGPDGVARLMCEARLEGRTDGQVPGGEASKTASLVARLCGGRPAVVRALVETMCDRAEGEKTDPLAAMAAALSPVGRINALCHYSYEMRLHRARGYGALKAILDILAAEEPLTLTEISRQLGRTPGSTKDYLWWLEDVDLVSVNRKRYRFRDPLVRLWVRLHCRPSPPGADEIRQEVAAYAISVGVAG